MRERLEGIHNSMHGYVNMGSAHVSFRDPFVYLPHSNVDRLFAQWQVNPAHPGRLNPTTVYGSESNLDVPVGGHVQNVNHNIEPWASGHTSVGSIAPWNTAPEVKTYKDPSVVTPPIYGTFLPATYQLSRAGDTLINWSAPDGGTYQLDISQATSGQWLMTNDSSGRPMMAFRRNSGQDAELVLSLEGAPSISSVLLHNEDDFPRKYYFASDGGNNNPLSRPAFILRAEGLSNSPVLGLGSFKVLCV